MKRWSSIAPLLGFVATTSVWGADAVKLPQADPNALARDNAVGLPHENSDDNDSKQVVLCRQGYAVSFNMETRNPDWAIEHLTVDSMKKKVDRKDAFQEDPDLKKAQPGLSSIPADYA